MYIYTPNPEGQESSYLIPYVLERSIDWLIEYGIAEDELYAFFVWQSHSFIASWWVVTWALNNSED